MYATLYIFSHNSATILESLKSEVSRIPPSLKSASELERMNREKVQLSHDLTKERLEHSRCLTQVNNKELNFYIFKSFLIRYTSVLLLKNLK